MTKMQQQSKASNWAVTWAVPVSAAVAGAIPLQTSYITGESMATKTASAPQQSATTRVEQGIDERYLNAKLEAVDARTETKFAQLIGKIDALAVSLTGVQTNVGEIKTELTTVKTDVGNAKGLIIATVIGAAIAIAGLAWAGVALFQGGMSATSDAYAAGATVGASKIDETS